MRFAVMLACVLALGAATAAQDRGRTRAQGKVMDETGKPLQDAIVAAVMEGFDKPFQQAKTNNKGEWRIDNLAAGKWKFHFFKEGLEEKAVDVQIGEGGNTTVPDVTLGKPVDHSALVNAELQRAAQLIQSKQPAEARKIYESILGKYPQLPADFRGQLHGAVAQTYGAENQHAQALEHMKQATELDPENVDMKLVYGELLIQAGQRAEGEKVLLSADMTKIKDPYPYLNVIISMINDQKSEEALTLLGKLTTQFPNEHVLLYYRGRAHLAAKKFPEARADLEKFVASAPPDARELPDAKKVLEQLKDIK
jgi:Tfp pilus assembly protein PilF